MKWLVRAGGPGEDHGYDLAFDGTGNVYVTGSFTSSATFQGLNGTSRSVTGSANTIFLAKYDASGALAWVQTGLAYYGTNQGYGVAVDSITGSVYLTGISQGDTTFSSSNGTLHSVSGPGTWHMVLAKFDTGGNFLWGQSNQGSPNSVGRRAAVDLDGNVYVTGWMEASTTFHSNDGHDRTVEGFSEPVQSGPDYPGDGFVVKYDENGNLQWVNHIGGYKAIPVDIASSRDGKISITGVRYASETSALRRHDDEVEPAEFLDSERALERGMSLSANEDIGFPVENVVMQVGRHRFHGHQGKIDGATESHLGGRCAGGRSGLAHEG